MKNNDLIVVTGGYGFIGSNIVRGLNARGLTNILVVDDLQVGQKALNLVGCRIADYMDKEDFLHLIGNDKFPGSIQFISHQGACSVTTEWDGQYMMRTNYEYTKHVYHYCRQHGIPLVYASSAAVYGANTKFEEDFANEAPLNVYGYSKWLFDEYLRADLAKEKRPVPVVGLRYFNVYGPHESHKGSMASVAFHFYHQIQKEGKLRLFEGCDGYDNGEQLRDFVFIDDVVKVNLWFMDQLLNDNVKNNTTGIFNIGTGRAQPFNDVANAVICTLGKGSIKYIPFPDHLKACYQSFTEANINRLRQAGYTAPFAPVETGVTAYMNFLKA